MQSWWLFDEQQIKRIDKLTTAARARFDALMRSHF
jgi:hypothetical protein